MAKHMLVVTLAATGAVFFSGAAAHGMMTLPTARNAGGFIPSKKAGPTIPQSEWFTGADLHDHFPGAHIPGKPTNCDARMLTLPPYACGKHNPYHPYGNKTGDMPWYAPGTAHPLSPCGVDIKAANLPLGKDGRDLPKTKRTVWQAGTTVEVGWSITVNHGGGYAFRLCPADSAQTEACFQQHHLQFAQKTTVIRWHNGSEHTIPARDVTTGTTPTGSPWRRNPIPRVPGKEFPAPCPGCTGNFMNAGFILVDRVALSSQLASGDYTLSWRWDTEENPQVWSNCADVAIVGTPAPPSPPPSPPSPSECGTCKVCFNPANHKCQDQGAHRPKTKAACEAKQHIWCGAVAFEEYV